MMLPSLEVSVYPLGDRRWGTNDEYIELTKLLGRMTSCPVEFRESASAEVAGDGAIVLCQFDFHLYEGGGERLEDAAPSSQDALGRRIPAELARISNI